MRRFVRDAYGGPEVLHPEAARVREPRADEVLVRVAASSVNTADVEHLEGRPWVSRVGLGLREPRNRVPGFDVAGEVLAVGPEVTRLAPGDRVWADVFEHGAGAFAPFVTAPERAFAALPEAVPFEAAATVPHSGLLAWQALAAARVGAGDRVLVNGAGGCVGPLAIQLAKHLGAHVTAVDEARRATLMLEAGADEVVDHERTDVTRDPGRAGLDRFDAVVDIAARRSFLAFRRVLAPRGRYVLIARSVSGFLATATLGPVLGGRRRMGVFGWRPSRLEHLETLGRLLASGALRPQVDRSFPLAETPAAIEHVRSRRALGKVLVVPEEDPTW